MYKISSRIKKEDCENMYHYLKQMSEYDFVVLDTETTGLDENSEIIELAIIDKNGTMLLNTLIKPSQPMAEYCEAVDVHGITNEMLFRPEIPTWEQIYPQFQKIIKNKKVFIYNAKFDKRLLEQTQRKISNKFLAAQAPLPNEVVCLMEGFATWYGEDSYTKPGTYHWHRLSQAAKIVGYTPPSNHRALSDCKTALMVLRMILLAEKPSNIKKVRKSRAQSFVQHLFNQNAIILNINHFLEIKQNNKSATNADILDICIMDMAGNILLNQQINPLTKYRKTDFLKESGWELEYLRACPDWISIYPKIHKILQNKMVIVYNFGNELLTINNYNKRYKDKYSKISFQVINFRKIYEEWFNEIYVDYTIIMSRLKVRAESKQKTALSGCQIMFNCLMKIHSSK